MDGSYIETIMNYLKKPLNKGFAWLFLITENLHILEKF